MFIKQIYFSQSKIKFSFLLLSTCTTMICVIHERQHHCKTSYFLEHSSTKEKVYFYTFSDNKMHTFHLHILRKTISFSASIEPLSFTDTLSDADIMIHPIFSLQIQDLSH